MNKESKRSAIDFVAGCIAWLIVAAVGVFLIFVLLVLVKWSVLILDSM